MGMRKKGPETGSETPGLERPARPPGAGAAPAHDTLSPVKDPAAARDDPLRPAVRNLSVLASRPDSPPASGMDPLRVHPRNPRRPPDWRWLRAGLLADGLVKPSRRHDDTQVTEAARFLAALRRCRDEADQDALGERAPDLAAAHAIYTGESHRRWAVEARVLAGEPFAGIAAKADIPVTAVACYVTTFFDVLGQRGHGDWLVFSAVGWDPGRALSEQDLGVTWRLFGLNGGPLVVDALVGLHPVGGQPVPAGGVNAFFTEQAVDQLYCKVAVAAVGMRADPRSVPKLLDVFLRLQKDAGRPPRAGPALVAIEPNARAMWDGLPEAIKAELTGWEAAADSPARGTAHKATGTPPGPVRPPAAG